MRKRIGREGTAPCGHPGEYVIGTFVQCLQGCDSKPGSPRGARRYPLSLDEAATLRDLYAKRAVLPPLMFYPLEDLDGVTWTSYAVGDLVAFTSPDGSFYTALLIEGPNLGPQGNYFLFNFTEEP